MSQILACRCPTCRPIGFFSLFADLKIYDILVVGVLLPWMLANNHTHNINADHASSLLASKIQTCYGMLSCHGL